MKMFIVDLRHLVPSIREHEVEVRVCKKTVWAVRSDGRRHLIGSSAFQTRPAAERALRGILNKIVTDSYMLHKKPDAVRRANKTLHTLH